MRIDPESVVLRPATPADSEFAYELKKAALMEYVAQVWGWDEDFQREFHEREFEAQGTDIVVHEGRDIGLVRTEREPDHIYVRHIYLLPEAQGQGIGSHLIEQVVREAEGKHQQVRLHVLKVNVRAKELYETLGFEVVGETDTHYGMETPR